MSKNGHLYSNENLKPNLLMYFLVHKNEKWSFCEFATVYATMHSNKNGSLAMMCIDAKQSFQSCFSLSRLIYFITGCRKCFIPKRLYSLHVLMLRGTYFQVSYFMQVACSGHKICAARKSISKSTKRFYIFLCFISMLLL